MNKLLMTALLATAPLAALLCKAQQPNMVFLYNIGEREGLRIAYGHGDNGDNGVTPDNGTALTDVAQVLASDYSTWGSEKRMYSPFVFHIDEGGYVAVFQVNDYAPCFAVAYSDNLYEWRPQDYPRMSGGGCLAPVVRSEGEGTYAVLYKTKEGAVRKTTTDRHFRHFSADVASSAEEYAAADRRDTLTVGDRQYIGNAFIYNTDDRSVADITAYYERQNALGALGTESLADDATRFASLIGEGPLHATLHISDATKQISDCLVGIFFEDISYAADGGLYAEMVQNRDFEYNSNDRGDFTATTAWHSDGDIVIADEEPLSAANPHYAVLSNQPLYNSGWDGIPVRSGAKYDFSIFANNIDSKTNAIIVTLVSDGNTIASASIDIDTKRGWRQYGATLSPSSDAEAQLMIMTVGEGRAAVDMVSLFPQDTFKGRKNGMRNDLAQVIADLHPKFVRFPGGCMSHGWGLENIYHWNHSVGALEERLPDKNIWQYHQTRGLGFYEYFQFCEDIGAEPLPVLAAAVPCQNSGPDASGYGSQQGGIPMDDMPAYIDEILHLIEWANGDPATSQWAMMRAEAGHPEPFNLKYLGIGNEDIISTVFEERCKMICQAVKDKYPDIRICGTAGPFHAPSSDYMEGWRFANDNKDLFYMIDEHYYESVGWFINNQHYYDTYDRSNPKVYLGEYAARSAKGLADCALAEALHLCGIERNGDVVAMTSYAPLLCNDLHHNWDPDMIYFTHDSIDLTPSYHTQRLFSVYSGDTFVESSLSLDDNSAANDDALKRVAATVVRDSKTGRSYLKIVNVLPVTLSLCVTAADITLSANRQCEGFSAQPGQERVTVVTSSCGTLSSDGLHVDVAPYSLTAVQL